ncbi:MAG: hypothetical protein INQ03_24965 [Candidatus Heimdallarchaeota archaeon]|nr:hypothetical protein [Candidatus Heimdallarchaeota archaeon]
MNQKTKDGLLWVYLVIQIWFALEQEVFWKLGTNMISPYISRWSMFTIYLAAFLMSINLFRHTRIQEFLIAGIAPLFIVFYSIFWLFSVELANSMYATVILPWIWFSIRLTDKKALRIAIVVSTLIYYPPVLYSMIRGTAVPWQQIAFFTIPVFFSIWVIITSALIKLTYISKRTRIGKWLLFFSFFQLAFFMLFYFIIETLTVETYFHDSIWFILARLSAHIWPFTTIIILYYFPEGFILTKNQVISAIHKYKEVENKRSGCEVFCDYKINNYLRNIPEDIINQIDDDKLTTTWIELQGTKS